VCPVEGREIRISTGTRDEAEAEEQKRELEAKLLLGIESAPKRGGIVGPNMRWEEFRERYEFQHVVHMRERSQKASDSRLDIATRIIKPRTLGVMASREALTEVQSQLLAGAESRRGKPRSKHTVKTMMATILAALHWGESQGWIEAVPKIQRVKTSKLRSMKGRPIAGEEFDRMVSKVSTITGAKVAESWRFLLRGLWESGLRLDELLSLSWDDENGIMPVWKGQRFPVLNIPASQQKNDTEESIPLLPWLDALLQSVPEADRTGYIFQPGSLQGKVGRPDSTRRISVEWCGKVIVKIGKAANIVVHPGDKKTGRLQKFASAHDLRRSCAERLIDAGVPERIVQRIMRHATFETTRKYYSGGTVQREAALLHEKTASKRTQVHPEVRQADDSRKPPETKHAR